MDELTSGARGPREPGQNTLRRPRLRVAWVMAFIAFVALNFGAGRALSDLARLQPDREGQSICAALALGTLPMANILAFGLLIAHRCRRCRPFLIGFEAFGVVALGLYLIAAILFTREVFLPYFSLTLKVVESIFGPPTGMTTAKALAIMPVAIAVQVLPQLTLALVGGSLTLVGDSLLRGGLGRTWRRMMASRFIAGPEI